MKPAAKLLGVKLIHTIIWIFFNVVIFYLLYTAVTGRINVWTWICLGIIILEGVVLLLFKNMCPVTVVARKYSDSTKDNFDIFLPNWLAKYNKIIYTTIVAVAVILLIIRLL